MRARRIPPAVFLIPVLLILFAAGVAWADNPPTVTAPALEEVIVGTQLTFTVFASDPDGDPIASFTAAPLPAGATFTDAPTNTSATFNWTPSNTQSGSYNVTFTASNALSGSATTSITVFAPDFVPVVTAPTSASGDEGTLIAFTVSATDPDGTPINSLIASGSAMNSGGTFSVNPQQTSGTFNWTPSFAQAGMYAATFTATNDLAGTATTSITVVNVDRPPVVIAPATASFPEGTTSSFTVSVVDPDGDAIFSLTASGSAIDAGGVFTSGIGNVTGTFTWTPAYGQAGSYLVTFTASNILSGSASTAITVITGGDRPPVVIAPAAVAATEGLLMTFTVNASDPDGEAIASLTAAPLPAGASFTASTANTSGTFSWTPTSSQAGTYSVTFTATNALSGSASTVITVSAPVAEQPPTIFAPASAAAQPGYTVVITGEASDPDGQTVTLSQVNNAPFLTGPQANGPTLNPSITLTGVGQFGSYAISWTATDNVTSTTFTTVVVIGDIGRVFTTNSNRTIKLESGKPLWGAAVEPVYGAPFAVMDIDPSTAVLRSRGTGVVDEIPVTTDKGAIIGDADRNGSSDITFYFSKENLRRLFSNISDVRTVDISIAGTLWIGEPFVAYGSVEVDGTSGALQASVAPNPLNPSGLLTFTTRQPGRVSLRIFDLTGRLIRTLSDSVTRAGDHDLRIDGRDALGRPLATGTYFYRLETRDGSTTGRFSVLK